MNIVPGPTGSIKYSYPEPAEILLEESELLADLVPDDLALYKSYFIDHWPRRCFFVKKGYGKRFPFYEKKNGNTGKTLPAFPDMLASLLERHLDYRRYVTHHRTHSPEKFSSSNDDQLFWFGLYGGRKTSLECLDIDNKLDGCNKESNVLGYYRKHKDGPALPVVRLTLEYLQRLKQAYDHFPGCVWCISSEMLGCHLWRKLPGLVPTAELQRRRKVKLNAVGLGSVEVYPSESRCLRRPFGRDYRTITPEGILTDWIEQTRHFDRPGRTPSFSRIVTAIKEAQVAQAWDWKRCVADRRSGYVDLAGLLEDWKQIQTWLKGGPTAALPSSSRQLICLSSSPSPKPATHKPLFDLEAMRHGRWPLELLRLAVDGLPSVGSLGPVCHEMAKWLYWIELYGLPPEQRQKEVLRQ